MLKPLDAISGRGDSAGSRSDSDGDIRSSLRRSYGYFRTYDFCTYDSRVSFSSKAISKSCLRPLGTTY